MSIRPGVRIQNATSNEFRDVLGELLEDHERRLKYARDDLETLKGMIEGAKQESREVHTQLFQDIRSAVLNEIATKEKFQETLVSANAADGKPSNRCIGTYKGVGNGLDIRCQKYLGHIQDGAGSCYHPLIGPFICNLTAEKANP